MSKMDLHAGSVSVDPRDVAFQDGEQACLQGLPKSANPYMGETLTEAWRRGWLGMHERMMLDIRERKARIAAKE